MCDERTYYESLLSEFRKLDRVRDRAFASFTDLGYDIAILYADFSIPSRGVRL